MEYGKKHIYLTWASDVRLLNFLVMNNRCVLPAQHTLFHFTLFWFLWYIYDIKRLEQRQSVPQSKGESYRCSALLAPCKPVQEYQLISPTILTLYCLLMPSANFEGWSLYMVLPLELALKPVPIQIFLFTELPLAPLRGGLSLSLWWLIFYMTYKYHFESAFSPVLWF